MNAREPRMLNQRHPIRAEHERRHRVPVEIKRPLAVSSPSEVGSTPRVAAESGRPARIVIQVPLPKSFSAASAEVAGASR